MNEGERILIVEDEAPIREGLRDRLTREGFRVSEADSVAAGRRALQTAVDIIILDRRLPDGDGLELLRSLRRDGATTPVIVLSALGQTDDRIDGLERGADDYVTKPFHLGELVARTRAVLGRTRAGQPREGSRLRFGEFEINIAARLLRRGRREVPISKLEFDLLLYFARNPDRAISRHELLNQVWGYDKYPTTRTVDYHVLALRKKIEPKNGQPRHLVTVHRVGYRFAQ